VVDDKVAVPDFIEPWGTEIKISSLTFVKISAAFALICGLSLSDAHAFNVNNPPPEVVATWAGGIQFLPPSATLSGETEEVSFVHEAPADWSRRVQEEFLKPGAKVPAVIYLHGCNGPINAKSWAWDFAEFGFAFFAPDSFRRPGRTVNCQQGNLDSRIFERHYELAYALNQIQKLPWVDQKRLILVGFSEGAHAASDYGGDGFIAHILLGNDCRFGGPSAPSGVAVLNIVGTNDRYGYGGGCNIWRDVGGSKSVVLKNLAHNVQGNSRTLGAIAKFLEACCGYQPVSATASLDPEATAKKLVEEFGGLATLDAMLKAEEAAGKGDEEGHKFWMRVHEIAMKLTGG